MVTRRRLLSGAAGLAALSGCLQVGYVGSTGSGRSPVDLPVPESDLVRGTPRDAIPAITDPAFGPDWSGVSLEARTVDFGVRRIEPRLAPFDRVVGLVRDGRARAYPLRVLGWHEVVNDVLGEPLLVSYCPLCGSAVVARRRVAGAERFGGSGSDATGAPTDEAITFGVSGLLWNDNLVMYDAETDSLWSQIAATAIRGPLAGTELELVPATLARWDEWRSEHPDTEVLLPPPRSDTVVGRGYAAVRDYTFDPYAAYGSNDDVGFAELGGEERAAGGRSTDDRLPAKVEVLGVVQGEAAKAYPRPIVERERVIDDRVGGVPVVVAVTPGGSMVAYERTVGGRTLEFRAGADDTAVADGSRWRVTTGEAVDGPHAGATLARANDRPAMFWFAWADVHPGTAVYGEPG
ncbi:MAG: DUF3179 domain-containing protein [Haloarculaceae archaeon]